MTKDLIDQKPDRKDRAIFKASALVGYCESADADALKDEAVRERWIKRLQEYAAATGSAISDVWASKVVYLEESDQ